MKLHRLISLLVVLSLTHQLFARDQTDILVMKRATA
jgi:hypothetical protein